MQRAIVQTEGDDYDPSRFLKASTVARAVRNAVETPSDAHPAEIILRPWSPPRVLITRSER